MAAETGHQPNRVYTDQNGDFHLNGAKLFDANEIDMAGNGRWVGGVLSGAALSSAGITDVVTGLTGIIGASATVMSTAAPTTAAGVAQQCSVGFSTASGTLQILGLKYTTTANTQLIAATATSNVYGWTAYGF